MFITEGGCDYVRVYDGNDTAAPLLHAFSGTSRPSDVFSSGNTVFVSFVTDISTTEDGFNIVYSTITSGKTQRLCKFIDIEQRYVTLSVPLMLNEVTTIDYIRPDLSVCTCLSLFPSLSLSLTASIFNPYMVYENICCLYALIGIIYTA